MCRLVLSSLRKLHMTFLLLLLLFPIIQHHRAEFGCIVREKSQDDHSDLRNWKDEAAIPEIRMTVGGSGSFFKNVFILIGGQSLHNTVVAPATHRHKSATGAHASPCPEPPSHLPLHPIPLSCPRALALSALLHASNRFLGNRSWVQFWICEIWYAY